MTAWQRRLRQWSRMTSKQKLADMEKEDRRRKMLRAGLDSGCTVHCVGRGGRTLTARIPKVFRPHGSHPPCVSIHAAAAQPLYHEKP